MDFFRFIIWFLIGFNYYDMDFSTRCFLGFLLAFIMTPLEKKD